MDLQQYLSAKGGELVPSLVSGQVGAFLRQVASFLQRMVDDFATECTMPPEVQQHGLKVIFVNSDELGIRVLNVETPASFLLVTDAGLPLALLDLFLAAMSHPSFCPAVGHAEVEVAWANAPPAGYFSRAQVLWAEPTDDVRTCGFFRVPQDLDRIRYAFSMCYDALMFHAYHELAHLFRGHMTFIPAVGPPAGKGWSSPHIRLAGTINKRRELLQFFELDADRYACELTFFPLVPQTSLPADWRSDELDRFFLAVTCAMLARHRQDQLEDYRSSEYCHPYVRQKLQVGWTFASVLAARSIESDGQVASIFSAFHENLDRFCRLLGPSIPLSAPFLRTDAARLADERRAFYDDVARKYEPLARQIFESWGLHMKNRQIILSVPSKHVPDDWRDGTELFDVGSVMPVPAAGYDSVWYDLTLSLASGVTSGFVANWLFAKFNGLQLRINGREVASNDVPAVQDAIDRKPPDSSEPRRDETY